MPAPGVGADEPGLSEDDHAAIRFVIESQLEAFRRDDGAAAFGYASAGIRAKFRTVENFMTMVREGYLPVYRARDAIFEDIVVLRGEPAQKVIIVGPDGIPVLALYVMEQQSDGDWKIDGCTLFTTVGKAT